MGNAKLREVTGNKVTFISGVTLLPCYHIKKVLFFIHADSAYSLKAFWRVYDSTFGTTPLYISGHILLIRIFLTTFASGLDKSCVE